MNKKVLFTVTIIFVTLVAKSQTNYLTVSNYIRLPKDSITNLSLIRNLDSFLIAAQKEDNENQWILPNEKAETQILLDEIHGVEKSDSMDFKPYLINAVPLRQGETYLIQVAYISLSNAQPLLRACFEFIAHKTENGFLFSSPLLRQTKDWKIKEIGNCIFHYPNHINHIQAESYSKTISKFDSILQSPIKITELYICDNSVDLLKVMGINYKLDYNGYAENSTFTVANGKMLIIQGLKNPSFDQFDPHDLFHERVSAAIPTGRNHFMVCGCAYLQGGSWGITWEGIQKLFKNRMVYDKKTDWLKLYYERYNFGESEEEHLLIPQFVNALIIQKVEKEQGFSAVIELLSSGNMITEREHFFKVLEKVTGINEKNFNKEVGSLVNDAMKTIEK